MTTVIGCAPVKVTQFGNFVLVELPTRTEALALEQAFADARLAQENPAELSRRYAVEHGINQAQATSE